MMSPSSSQQDVCSPMIKSTRLLASTPRHEKTGHPHLLRMGSRNTITDGTDELWGEVSIGSVARIMSAPFNSMSIFDFHSPTSL
jgi:hypothetical protein